MLAGTVTHATRCNNEGLTATDPDTLKVSSLLFVSMEVQAVPDFQSDVIMGHQTAKAGEVETINARATTTEFEEQEPHKKHSTSKHKKRKVRKRVGGVETRDSVADTVTSLPTPSPTPMPATRTLPLLVCSIGNPGSTYANTLHSAGHTVLNRLAEHLGYSGFHKDRSLGNGLVSKPSTLDGSADWTLWQSTSYMNESGKGVRAAWTAWSRNIAQGEARLVVIYDELEKALGTATLRTTQGASAKGHNGLKSIMSVMGSVPFARIGVGIGRPTSRDSDDVARYVLQKMSPSEKAKIEGAVDEVIGKLKQLEMG